MKGNSTKRMRHAFQPSVDPLEGRVVLSSGVSARAAHLHQLQVQRQHRAELRHERQLARQHEFLLASQLAQGAQNTTAGTSSSTTATSSSTAGTAANGGQNARRHSVTSLAPAFTRVVRSFQAGSVASSRTSNSGANARQGINPNLANVIAGNLTGSAINGSTIGNTTVNGTATSRNNTTTGPLFTNVPTGAGTFVTSNNGLNNGTVAFRNLPITAGTSAATTGLNNTGNVFATVPPTIGTLVNSTGINPGFTTLPTTFGTTANNIGFNTPNGFPTLPTTFGTTANNTGFNLLPSTLGTVVNTNTGLNTLPSTIGNLVNTAGINTTGTLGQFIGNPVI